MCKENDCRYFSKVFILVLSLRASSLAAWASFCFVSRYVICFYNNDNNNNDKKRGKKTFYRIRLENSFEHWVETAYSERRTQHLLFHDIFPHAVQISPLLVHRVPQTVNRLLPVPPVSLYKSNTQVMNNVLLFILTIGHYCITARIPYL